MEPDDLLCSRNARSQKGGRGAARPSFLLAEAARSECAPSMRAGKDRLATPLRAKWGKSESPCSGYWHVPGIQLRSDRRVGRVRKSRAIGGPLARLLLKFPGLMIRPGGFADPATRQTK
jgi:hypothetical protein